MIPLTGATDLSAKRGYLVTISGETATLSASATTPARGVVLEGADTDGVSSVGILGTLEGSVMLKLSGTVTKGDRLQQHTDGSVVTDAGTGARTLVGVALEDGKSGDLIECATHVPIYYAA